MSNIFFSSDHHWGHMGQSGGIIAFCNRPFSSIGEMNESLIKSWNRKVGKKDVVYHLGDFAFGGTGYVKALRSHLNGAIHLVKGNHDYRWSKVAFEAFDSVSNLKQISIDGQTIVMCHFPIESPSWNKARHGSWMLHGHRHASVPFDPEIKRLDVGIDGTKDFSPYSFDEVRDIFANPNEFQYIKRY